MIVKELLFVYDTEQEMNAKEKELVTEEFCKRKDTYNICEGGLGGFGYINSKDFNNSSHSLIHMTKMSKAAQNKLTKEDWFSFGVKSFLAKSGIHDPKYGIEVHKEWAKKAVEARDRLPRKPLSEEHKRKISLANSKKTPWNKGVPRTKEEKEKIGKGVKKYRMNLL